MNWVEYYPTATVSSFIWSQIKDEIVYILLWGTALIFFIVFRAMVIFIMKIKQPWVLSFVVRITIFVIRLYIVTANRLEVIVRKAVARLGPSHWNGITLIPAWISDYMHFKGWDEITNPFPNFNGCTIEVWEWIIIFIQHLNIHVISLPYWKNNKTVLLRDTRGESAAAGLTTGQPRPRTPLGRTGGPYLITTQFYFNPVMSKIQNSINIYPRILRRLTCPTQVFGNP